MKYSIAFTIIISAVLYTACSPANGNRTGHEFMPDMVHPIGYEANLYNYYYYNRWGTEDEYYQYAMPRLSVPGTIPRGESALAYATDETARMDALGDFKGMDPNAVPFTPNGSVPYYYDNTEEERLRATREITKNPFPITAGGLTHGMELYNIYCGICHGASGDGQGYLVREGDPAKGITAGVYPAAPANLLLDTFMNASVGRMYHAIMFGKNVMGPYADKLSYRERWEVIHYIRSLQANSKKLVYSDTLNTFNSEAIPWTSVKQSVERPMSATDTLNTRGGHGTGSMNTNNH